MECTTLFAIQSHLGQHYLYFVRHWHGNRSWAYLERWIDWVLILVSQEFSQMPVLDMKMSQVVIQYFMRQSHFTVSASFRGAVYYMYLHFYNMFLGRFFFLGCNNKGRHFCMFFSPLRWNGFRLSARKYEPLEITVSAKPSSFWLRMTKQTME